MPAKKVSRWEAAVPPLAYSVPQTMQALGIGRDRLYGLLRSKRLIARKVGKRTLILAEDLQAFAKALPKYGDGAAS
jgi:excisionase family DNA binding protein